MFQRLETGKSRLLQGYVDADYARDLDQQRSTTSYVFTVAGCVINWKAVYKIQFCSFNKKSGVHSCSLGIKGNFVIERIG